MSNTPDNTASTVKHPEMDTDNPILSHLKEAIKRSEQHSVSQEKVDEYMSKLTKATGLSRAQHDVSGSARRPSIDSIPAKERVNLIRQQLAQNRAKLAEKDRRDRGIEAKVAQMMHNAQLEEQSKKSAVVATTVITLGENSPPEELYRELMQREQRIKTLEAQVLDLGENVKEKEQIIEARTKAITLMTDSLNKKRKHTLDDLEDTKQQMQVMQEEFVRMEGEMKDRQLKLLDDLKLKNQQIAELQQMSMQHDQNVTKVKELNDELQRIQKENERLVERNDSLETQINTMKKHLDTSNKDMIRIKAQSNAKVKELNQKLNQLKDSSDTNANLLKLNEENAKLLQKIAELEEDKGSLQLKIVELESTKDNKDFENEVLHLQQELSKSREELELLRQQHASAEVCTQITSIQLEEQLDISRTDLEKLRIEMEALSCTHQELQQQYDILNTEKTELNGKLDFYIQANTELTDKLEKLSTEKVSSAESIEIVEALTQQERIEMEEYQNAMLTHSTVENRLLEEHEQTHAQDYEDRTQSIAHTTAMELAERVEMFTIERREVMDRMEQLNAENNSLREQLSLLENKYAELLEQHANNEGNQQSSDLLAENLRHKNCEQLERMKKIAANLKRKAQQCEELERTKSQLLQERQEMKDRICELEHQLKETQQPGLKSEPCNPFVDRDVAINNYELQICDLNGKVICLQESNNQLNEKIISLEAEIVVKEVLDMALSQFPDTANEMLVEQLRKLECMLSEVERERDKHALQCEQLSTELARIVNERECLKSVEAQIQTDSRVATSLDGVDFPIVQFSPVAEEPVAQRKSAYICTDEDETRQPIGDNDDGWSGASSIAPSVFPVLHSGVSETELQARIESLEIERCDYLEQIQQLQLKVNKLVKKCKEFKAKLEQRSRLQTGSTFLEDTIQDELRQHVEELGSRLKQSMNDLKQERSQRADLDKKFLALTLVNGRIVEDRDRLKVELINLQREHSLEEKASKTRKMVTFATNTEDQTCLYMDEEQIRAALEAKNELEKQFNELKTQNLELVKLQQQNKDTEQQYLIEVQKLEALLADTETKLQQVHEQNNDLNLQLKSLQNETNKLQVQLDFEKEQQLELNHRLEATIRDRQLLEQNHQEQLDQQKHLCDEYENQWREKSQEKLQLEAQMVDLRLELERNTQALSSQITQLNTDKRMLEEQIGSLTADLNTLQTVTNRERKLMNDEINSLSREKEDLQAMMQEHFGETDNQKRLEGVEEQCTRLEAELSACANEKHQRDAKIQELTTQIAELQETIQECEKRIDQRGLDVAESWKLHLETRESEFVQTQMLLKQSATDLEEKCDSLLNENNELRRNIDSDIRNEVGKIEALESQLVQNKELVDELRSALANRQSELIEIESLFKKHGERYEGVTSIEELLSDLYHAKDSRAHFQAIVDKANVQLDELRAQLIDEQQAKEYEIENSHNLQQTIADLQVQCALLTNELDHRTTQLETYQQGVKKYEQQDLEAKQMIDDYAKTIETLKKQLVDYEMQKEQLQEELAAGKEKYHHLEICVNELEVSLSNKEQEIKQLQYAQEENESKLLQLYDKEEECARLTRLISSLEARCSEQVNNITQLRLEMEVMQQRLSASEQEILAKENEMIQIRSGYESNLNETQKMQINVQELKQQTAHLQQLNDDMKAYVSDYEARAKGTETDFKNIVGELEQRNVQLLQETTELRQWVDTKDQQLLDLNKEWARISDELKVLHLSYNELQSRNRSLQESELQKITEYNELIDRMNALEQEDNKQLLELKEIIEEQAGQIEDLKKKYHDKCKEIDHMLADGSTVVRSSMGTGGATMPDAVSRAELDLALYVMHQRDVRYEEMTVELTQLLEERDTLQLRLSNAIREVEEWREKAKEFEASISETPDVFSVSTPTIRDVQAKSSPLGDSGIQDDQLASKLSELRSVRYKRDKRIVDEQEFRRLQEMSIIQQHGEAASMLPPEAAARLVDANYTLSRDVQSTPKVLLNWLWGRSTPKESEGSV